MGQVVGYQGYCAVGTAGSETNITSYVDSAEIQRLVAKLDGTTFGATAKVNTPGLPDSSEKVTCKYDVALMTILDPLMGVAGKSLVVGPEGNGTGKRKLTVLGFVASLGEKYAVAALDMVDVEFAPSAAVVVGVFP